jgi:hypothetical protein
MSEKERHGWVWNECGSGGGYWSRIDNTAKHKHTLPLFCPCCEKITGTFDDKFLGEWGICGECYVMNIENRKVPLIDVSKYKK